MERLLLATDAWHPQINGVVQTLSRTIANLRARGIMVEVVTPGDFATVPLPTYPDIRIALVWNGLIRQRLDSFRPDHVHIATEGPIGWAARAVSLERHLPFTTSYHTRFPEYLRQRAPIPVDMSYSILRHFHNAAAGTLVATGSIAAELTARGFDHLLRWGRGVDLVRFTPEGPGSTDSEWMARLPRPLFLSVGRVAPEKNLEAFLALDLPGSKVVVGDGPALAPLKLRFPDAHFLGARPQDALPPIYRAADVFVFPSRTDTFGLVLVEAMASGLPVAAYPVAGPLDVVGDSGAGALHEDLSDAAHAALAIDRARARTHAQGFTWDASTDQFLAALTTARARFAAGTAPIPMTA
jgi:glycosyltransferase involved in cell wall biosynthesis